MKSQLQNDSLVDEFHKAKERHDGARKRVDPIVTRLHQLNTAIVDTEVKMREVDARHDQMNRHIRTQRRRNQHLKAAKKKQRRNDAGAEKSDLSYQLRSLYHEHADTIKSLKAAKVEVDYDYVERKYYSLRHRLMMAIREAEATDELARQRKQVYLRSLVAAGHLQEAVTIDELLYYEDDGKVHLFYGGRKSYNGGAQFSPDGRGHGHYVLDAVVHTLDGLHQCRYARDPS